jgi:phage shock protein A
MVRAGGSKGDDVNKLTPLALLAAVAALAFPVASWADDSTPPQSSSDKLARVQERIAKIEAKLDTASQKLAAFQQKLAEKCNTDAAPAPESDNSAAGPSRARVCALAQAKLERAHKRLELAQDRVAKLKDRVAKWQQKHAGPSLSAADQAALNGLQQQLAGIES